MNRFAWIIVLLSSLLFACRPGGEIIPVPDNTAPPNLTVPEVIRENYLNKLYITLLGRKPNNSEFSGGMSLLDQDNVSVASRKALIDDILNQDEYVQRSYEVAKSELLLNLDTADISIQIYIYSTYLDSPQFEPFFPLLEYEIDRLTKLKTLPYDMLAGTANRKEMHRRMVSNGFYDEINMGSQNFVLSMFEYFFGRYPTESELQSSIIMVDGFTSIVLGEEGHSKDDFVDIFLNSDDYYEGEVIDIYRDFLFRDPNSQEMGLYTISYRQSDDYSDLLKEILSLDEYLGI